MAEFTLAALILLPVILAVVAGAVCWRYISSRALFIVATALSLFGLQSLAAPAATSVFLPGSGGLSLAVAHAAHLQSVVASAIIQLVVGIPFIWWLYRAFRKP